MNKAYLTVAETVKYTSMSRSRVYELIKSRELRAVKVGKTTLIKTSELLEFMESLPAYGEETKFKVAANQ